MFSTGQTRHPDKTAFKLQTLPAWHPVFSPKFVFRIFLVISLTFIPIGVILLMNSENVVEFVYDYTECVSQENSLVACSNVRSNVFRANESCTCQYNFFLSTAMSGNVYAYYGLTNFFQNHRRYVRSRDDSQLVGRHVVSSDVSSDCIPYAYNTALQVYAPCGAIANSLFNDTFTLSYANTQVPFLRTGIAWETDHRDKFNNPSPADNLQVAFSSYVKPLFWQTPVQYLDNSSISNNGYKNEPLIVWMRTAAFSQFRKIYGRLDRTNGAFSGGLAAGNYSLTISYNYPVTSFFGQKRFILSTTSWSGGKNNFLGLAYIIFGSLCFVMSIIFCCMSYYAKKIHAVNIS